MKSSGRQRLGYAGVVLAVMLAGCHRGSEQAPPGPPFPAAGSIVYQCDGQTWAIAAHDGTGSTVIANSILENPSLGIYVGRRWDLRVKETGAVYQVQHPDGTVTQVPHCDLFARNCGAQGLADVEIQLTDYYGTYIVEQAHWCRSQASGVDAFISLLVTDISGVVRETEAGCFFLLESGEDTCSCEGAATILRLHVPGKDLAEFTSPLAPDEPRCERVLVGGAEDGLPLHAWSPDETCLAFLSHRATSIHTADTTTPSSIYVADVSNPPVSSAAAVAIPNTDYATFDAYAWSPDSTRILYRHGFCIWSVNPLNFRHELLLDEYSLRNSLPVRMLRQLLLGNDQPQMFVRCQAHQPRWSPDGQQVAYILEKQVLSHFYYCLLRTRWSDGATVALTGDWDKRLSKELCLWIEESADVTLLSGEQER